MMQYNDRKRLGKSDDFPGAEHSFSKRSKQSGNPDDSISFAECSFDLEIVYREKKGKKESDCANMIKHVVALLNTGGGVIRIHEHKNNKDTITKDRDDWIQALEQKLNTIIPHDHYGRCIHYKPICPYYYLFVRKSKHVCTQNSGLKLPLHRSVKDANYDDILDILTRVAVVDPPSEPSSLEMTDEDVPVDSGCIQDLSESNFTDDNNNVENFHHEKRVPFEESTTVQFKLIPDGKANSLDSLSKGLDNHLKNYVSAFANLEGGKIYFGINDNGIVKGQNVHSKTEKDQIKMMVEKIIKRKGENQEMIRIWGKPGFVPIYGKQWTVEFADVIGVPEGKEMCVIVVEVFPFYGGMFLQPPQSWKVDETSEKIVQMGFYEWKNRHICHTSNQDEQEMLERFDCLTIDSIGKRVYQLKDMVNKFAKNVFPAKKGLEKVPTKFAERIKLDNEKESIMKLEQKLHQSYADNRGFVMMDKAWWGNVGIEPAPAEVICDMFVVSHNSMPRMITVARRGSSAEKREKVRQYNLKIAKKLKLALVNKGVCLECFGIAPQIILLEDINDEMKLPLPIFNYPYAYVMTEHIFKKIRESLVIVLAGFENSSFNSTIGANFLYVLTTEQYNISIKEDQFILVEAPPGTGKTVVAIERIKRLRRKNVPKNEILYICENKPLASYIRSLRMGKSYAEDSELCLSQTRAGLMNDIDRAGYDNFNDIQHVVVDEAHNFRNENSEDWFASILRILKWLDDSEESNKGTSLYISYDPLQKARFQDCGLGILDSRQMLLNHSYTKCKLSSVIRNSKKIYQHWEKIALGQSDCKSGDLVIAHDYEGSDLNVVQLSATAGKEEFFPKVKEIINQILHEKAHKAADIAVLCNTKQDAERLESYLRDHLQESVISAEDFPRQGLVVDSFRRFSGLEAPVVIAVAPRINRGFEDPDKVKILLYSRAMVEFYFIGKEDLKTY